MMRLTEPQRAMMHDIEGKGYHPMMALADRETPLTGTVIPESGIDRKTVGEDHRIRRWNKSPNK